MGPILVLLSIVGVASGLSIQGIKTTEPFNNSIQLDDGGNYFLFWNFNSSHVTFEVHVKTTGWVGFGLSDNGNMFPGDVIVGWVTNNGSTYFADRHTKGRYMPIKDTSQDWHLLHGEENEFGTVLKFVRKIDTCDTTEDLIIPSGTTRVIYSYGQSDPVSEDAIVYHGPTSRGSKSMALLSSIKIPDLPDDIIHFDFLNDNYLVPNETTMYYCRGFFLPDIGRHHMIKYEPVITPGNEKLVHHILLYRCSGANRTVSANARGECYGKRPASFPKPCENVVVAWAIGGQPFYFPEILGFPIQEHNADEFYLMETHLDNPTRRNGVLDNSGLRITLTKRFRQHDAGLFQLGSSVTPFHVIPPGEEAFLSTGYCAEKCVSEGFQQSGLQEVKAFSALQHSHLLGVGMTTRHFRNGTELKPIMVEPAYDFNFQEVRMLPEELSLYPGDAFSVECTYDSRKRNGPTFGGLSTLDEMCLTFLYYYPAMKMHHCASVPVWDNYHIPRPMVLEMMRTADWTNKTFVDDFKDKLSKSRHFHKCKGDDFKKLSNADAVFHEPVPRTPYVPPTPNCS